MRTSLYVIAALFGVNAAGTAYLVGKERKPITPQAAAVVAAVDLALIAVLVTAARRLPGKTQS